MRFSTSSLLVALATGCAPASTHSVVPAALGRAPSAYRLASIVDTPGPVVVETIDGASWEVDRSELINLDDSKAKAAGLVDGPEPIHIYAHAIEHLTRGTFLADTGMERAYRDAPKKAAIQGLLAMVAHTKHLKVLTAPGDWLVGKEPLTGVFLTHLHIDHVTGLPDVPRDVPVYVGPGGAQHTALDHLSGLVISLDEGGAKSGQITPAKPTAPRAGHERERPARAGRRSPRQRAPRERPVA